MTILKWIGIGFAVACVVVAIAFFSIFYQMIFIAKITEKKVLKNSENRVFLQNITLNEIETSEAPLERQFGPLQIGVFAKEYEKQPNGELLKTEDTFSSDPDTAYQRLKTPHFDIAFLKGNLYSISENIVSNTFNENWAKQGFSHIAYAGYISHKFFIAIASRPQEFTRGLYQIDASTKQASIISNDTYFSFARPPIIFYFNDVTVVIYYVGDYSYGFGGDASSPQKSIVRVYNTQFPNGEDIAEISFASGTIVDVAQKERTLILTGDPSRPAASQQTRRPPRRWHLTF